MSPTSDVWGDTVARALVADLTRRGVDLQVRRGKLRVEPIDLVAADEVPLIRQHRDAMLVIVLARHYRCLDRLLDLRAGRLGAAATTTLGHCYVCGDALPGDRETGRCGWCALAVRMHAGAPIPADIITLFDTTISGLDRTVHATTATTLPYDLAVPA